MPRTGTLSLTAPSQPRGATPRALRQAQPLLPPGRSGVMLGPGPRRRDRGRTSWAPGTLSAADSGSVPALLSAPRTPREAGAAGLGAAPQGRNMRETMT